MGGSRLSGGLVLLAVMAFCDWSMGVYFEDGYDHHYTYSSQSDMLGMHNVTTVIKFRIRSVNGTSGQGALHQLMVDSFVQSSQEKGYVVDNPLNWHLDHRFYFTLFHDGLVQFVHYHPEEIDELVTLKKVLASTLTSRIQIESGVTWHFTSEEEDHAGFLVHQYQAQRDKTGLKFVRSHQSSKNVHRSHHKVIQTDHKFTPHHVEAFDNITLRHSPGNVETKTVEGAATIEEEISGEFPMVSSVSRTTAKLMVKSKHNEPTSGHSLHGLHQDSVSVKLKPVVKKALTKKLEEEIQIWLACIHAIPNKRDVNRTECVYQLREIVKSLKKDDFVRLGTDALTKKCESYERLCQEEKDLFIDLIAPEGSPEAQLMILEHVLNSPYVTEEDQRRCLFHAIAIQAPIEEMVRHVEDLCFEDGQMQPGETPTLTKTRRRACLSLGAMAKSLHGKNTTVSDRIVERIENWLDHHNESRSREIVKPKQRRSIIQHDHPARKHIETKTVLIQSLGNAGKQRSLRHIRSYMEPNQGVTAWRRAAIHSLRHFNCNESAHALLHTAVNDNDDIVRKTAISVLKAHPLGKDKNFTARNDHEVLSKNYSYPIITRVRRSLITILEDGIQVTIKPPGIEWEKIIGTKDVGASFGLIIRNLLDLKIGLLSGHFMVDVYDAAYVEVHVGMIDLKIEIVNAHICFKGHIEYNLNVLKDFGIDSLGDLVKIYDKILGKIVNPIVKSVKAFKDIMGMSKGRSFTDIVNNIADVIKHLPTKLGEVAIRMRNFVEELFSMSGNSIIDEIKSTVKEVRDYIDGVTNDVLKFYNDIVDAVTMALPFIAKKVTGAYNQLIDGVTSLINNPMAAISSLSRAVLDIKMAITMLVDVKNTVVDACLFIKGRVVEWAETAKTIPSLLNRLEHAFEKLVESIKDGNSVQSEAKSPNSDGLGYVKDNVQDLQSQLKQKWEHVLAPLKPLIDFVTPFVEEFKAIMDSIKNIKWGYKTIKKVIETSKSLVQKVFGPKFHRKFPTERRKGGVWPSTSGGTFSTTGVDLTATGSSIVMPVNGILNRREGDGVTIQPADSEFEALEIIIENINANSSLFEKNVKAGDKIGRSGGSFIHVSVRTKLAETLNDEDYDYTDPSPFLDRLMPVPKWLQECNDHEFRYIGQTHDSGEAAGDEKPEEKKEKLERGDGNDVDGGMGEESGKYRPDDPALYDKSSFGDSLKNSVKEQSKQFTNFFKTGLLSKGGPKIPNIMEIVNVNDRSVDWLVGKLDENSNTGRKFNKILDQLSCASKAEPKLGPATLTPHFMMNFLQNHNIGFNIGGDIGVDSGRNGGLALPFGDTGAIGAAMLELPEQICPIFKGAVSKGFGHLCFVHEDCLGITCNVPIPHGPKKETITASVQAYPWDKKIEVNVLGKNYTIQANGMDIELELDVPAFRALDMSVVFIANAHMNSDVLVLMAEFKVCIGVFAACLPPIELLHDIPFMPNSIRHKRATGSCDRASIMQMPVPQFMLQLAEFQLLRPNVTHILETIRHIVVEQLLNEFMEKLNKQETEFADKIDFCVGANIPVPVIDIPFPPIPPLNFMVGPVPMSIKFGIGAAVGLHVRVDVCFISMSTKLTLTPWIGGKVFGDIAIDIGIARGGMRLIGYVVETKFPMTTELVFSKYPIDVGAKMDLLLSPLRLQLKAFAEVDLVAKTITVFKDDIWTYKTKLIKKNIFEKKKRDDDHSPPSVKPATINKRRKRSGTQGCIVNQVYNRPYYAPAFTLEMHAEDEVSETKLSYAIGSHRGGTDILDWTDMGGSSLMVPMQLPGGIPIYWSVKAKNSQGLEAITQCFLKTYDGTLPDGRVRHSYKFSSHPNKLVASVVVFEDSPLTEKHYKAVGFSPGQYGSQFLGWQQLWLDQTSSRHGVSGPLSHFTVPQEGKLVAFILKTQYFRSPEKCAQACLMYGSNCISFDYEHHSETCDFHDVVDGANAYLRISGSYRHYERLGSGYQTALEYNNLTLTHGSVYFVNAKVSNILGYDAYLLGEGTLVDFTPPEPGLIKNHIEDRLYAEKCNASIIQQCVDVTWKENHRKIIDGPGSGTIFNGHEPVKDELYTLTNHYVAGNWKGFHDDESGIFGYTWAVGRNVCASDIINFEDPYRHLTSRNFWTDSAFHKGIHIPDGFYYITVQALNGAELGGSLVITVCHSTPFTVDTTPPVFHGVTDIIYDEDFDLIAIYYNATDALSMIADAEFGLGKTKYDVQLKAYSLHASIDRNDPYVAVEDLGIEEGIPAWIRIRDVDGSFYVIPLHGWIGAAAVTVSPYDKGTHVELFTAGHGDAPILIDRSPPVPGHVFDGDRLGKDRQYQMSDGEICAQWLEFYDPESGIDRYMWGVGTSLGIDDIVPFHNLTRYDKSSCRSASMVHNHTYYSIVFAYNTALNAKSSNSTSNGVLIDITPPIAGNVSDGKEQEKEQKYSSETVSKYSNWCGFNDPESGISDYQVHVYIKNELKHVFDAKTNAAFEDHTISMEHGDVVFFKIHAYNGADNVVDAQSDGFLVDQTSPIMTEMSDNDRALIYQSDSTKLNLRWDFYDLESGINHYKLIVYQTQYGVKQKFWPKNKDFNTTIPPTPFAAKMTSQVDDLQMANGVKFSMHVAALNGAALTTTHESNGVTVDMTPPSAPKVKIGLPNDEEELDDNNYVLHDDQNGIRVSWSSRDMESGIINYRVAIGKDQDPESIIPFTSYGTDKTAYINNIFLQPFSESNTLYVVTIYAENGAELESPKGLSKPIYVQKTNVAGIVFDGRTLYKDETYTNDHTSIAASFYGFESERCDIVSYQWAIGTTEYGTDVLTYTNYGVVMHNRTHGQCQIHTELFEDVRYFIAVRAVTGCMDEYIVSCSDGLILDRRPPDVKYMVKPSNDKTTIEHNGVVYQSTLDSLNIRANVSERHELEFTSWALGSMPLFDDKHHYTEDLAALTSSVILLPGEITFMSTRIIDQAGNAKVTSSFAIVADTTPPKIADLSCNMYVSIAQSLVTCNWHTIAEAESLVSDLVVSVGTNVTNDDVLSGFKVKPGANGFSYDAYHNINSNPDLRVVHIRLDVSNIVGLTKTYGHEVIVDQTGPTGGRLDVVTNVGIGSVTVHQKCQQPLGYIELRLLDALDIESEIDTKRYEAAIGTTAYGTDILDYGPVQENTDGIFFLNQLTLKQGSVFYGTIRIFNKAGLKSEISSDAVVVSQTPYLKVIEGNGDEDIDFQSLPSLFQGQWKYIDRCPIKAAYWSLEDMTGNVAFDFKEIPNAGHTFYNDEVNLENGMKYIVTVKTIDFLNRTKIAQSDGVSVRIQPPLLGRVRDGIGKDLNYQFSTTDLTANWDNFGDSSGDPTQSISHYEVAIGNDRRYASTRMNIHAFVEVGLNTSYTFEHLNLTAKLIRYYITVRSHSMAGSYVEGYSNGIRVGYDDDITPGSVTVQPYQSSLDTMEISWDGFQSDIDIIDYKLGISSHLDIISNDTLPCESFISKSSMYDISAIHSMDINEYVKQENLNLQHGKTYYSTVIAEDEAGMCTAVTSEPVLVDTTPPIKGRLLINSIESKTVSYVKLDTEMHVEWIGFHDPESGLQQSNIKLYECSTCIDGPVSDEICYLIDESSIQKDTKTAFYELELKSGRAYYIFLEVMNGAKLASSVQSASVLIDKTSPLMGEIKITDDWTRLMSYQESTSTLSGLLGLAKSWNSYICPSQHRYFPTGNNLSSLRNVYGFNDDFLEFNSTGAYLGIGYNSDLTEIVNSTVVSEKIFLMDGNFTFSVRGALGFNIVTTIAVVTDIVAVPFGIAETIKPIETEFDYSVFANISGLKASENLTDSSNVTTLAPPTTSTDKVIPNNGTGVGESNFKREEYGFGVDLLGYKIGNNTFFHHVFWARSKYSTMQRWFQMKEDPSKVHDYIINVARKAEVIDGTIDLSLFVDGEEMINIKGFKFKGDVQFIASVWNEYGYEPEIDDIYRPFYSDAVIHSVDVPDNRDRPCRHGRGFYDGESGIKEVWLGASDNLNDIGNIVSLSLYKTFCYPCIKPCDRLCEQPCSEEQLIDDFNQIPIHLTGLSLKMTDISSYCNNVSSSKDTDCNSTAYYLNVKIVNFAGEETTAHSNGISIDITPPACDYVKCLDPDYSEDEPTNHVGSSSTIGAYWNCTEDVSKIANYNVTVYDTDSNYIKLHSKSVGLSRKVKITLPDDTFENLKNYTFELTAANTAGLTTKKRCTVLVNLYPPDVSHVQTGVLYTKSAVSTHLDDSKPYWATSASEIGIQWSGGSNDTEFYEWRIGTQDDSSDLFPPLKLGSNSAGSSAIVHGKLYYNKRPINRTVGNFRNTTNMTAAEMYNATTSMDAENSFFNMEPGRCVHQSLYAIGLSHLKTKIQGKTVCLKRTNDVYIDVPAGGKHVSVYKDFASNKWDDTPSSATLDIIVDADVTSGGLSIGTLTSTDMTSDYGSAASADYRPFISDLSQTQEKTSRLLRNRIEMFCDKTFFLSPVPHIEFSLISIRLNLPPGCDKNSDSQPALIYWDIDSEKWKHTDEDCNEKLTADVDSTWYNASICGGTQPNINKRDDLFRQEKPREYTLVRISQTFPNTKPKIVPDTLEFTEDEVGAIYVETIDAENDDLVYDIVQTPANMNCNISADGMLICNPDEDFYGNNSIILEVVETGLPQLETPYTIHKQIQLNVIEAPDKTERFFLDHNDMFHEEKRPRMRQPVIVSANRTSSVYAGKIILADVDGGEVFTEHPRFTPLGNATYEITKTDNLSDVALENYTLRTYRTLNAYDVTFEFSPKDNGNMALDFIAQTANDAYTPGVTIEVYVLDNPCVHGDCDHPKRGPDACNDTSRAKSFIDGGYVCVCTPGYHGMWCESEINECESDPCSALFDCTDLVNAYTCTINIPKLLAIILCTLLALAVIIFVLRRVVIKYKHNKVSQSRIDLMDDAAKRMCVESPLNEESRPATANGKPRFNPSALGFIGMVRLPGQLKPSHHQRPPMKAKDAAEELENTLDAKSLQDKPKMFSSKNISGKSNAFDFTEHAQPMHFQATSLNTDGSEVDVVTSSYTSLQVRTIDDDASVGILGSSKALEVSPRSIGTPDSFDGMLLGIKDEIADIDV